MNKILIVGHPQSGYGDVERLLRACGMAPALPSRREGFAPEQISETLCKAHSTPPLHRLGNGREVQQIEVAPVWQSLAMDLMLGNIDQPLWGWADPQAVHLLDHWRTLDPTLHFILVYDRPQSVLTRTGLQEAATLTREALQQRVDAWSAYNAALLDFHLRNPQRSLLVHSEQVRQSAEAYLQQVRARIDAPWKERIGGPGSGIGGVPARLDNPVEDARSTGTSASVNGDMALDATALSTFIAGALLKGQAGSAALYEELQASANLPLETDLLHGEDPALGMEAWLSMVDQQEKLQSQRTLTRQLQAGREQAERLAQERERLLDEGRRLRQAEQQDAAQQLEALQQARAQVEAAQADTRQENELLLNQLHQVQEELERHYLASKAQAERIETLQQQERLLQAGREQAERLAQERERLLAEERRLRRAELEGFMQRTQLQETLQQQLADVSAREQQSAQQLALLEQEIQALKNAPQPPAVDPGLAEENELLLSQLHQVQEELERYYVENQRLKASTLPAAPTKTTPPPGPTGAAERVKRQLGYRLGARMIECNRTPLGWMTMPWALWGEVRRFRRERAQAGTQKLPPIHAYRDAQEAERVRQHLSYRLGTVMLAHSRSLGGWFRMPFALRREVRRFREEKRR